MQTRQNLDLIEKISHHLGSSIKVLLICLRPPIDEVTIFIKLATLIIESMCHLMTNNNTDCAVVEGIISLHIEERILENTGGETDLIAGRIVICIHRLWRHVPFGFVHRFA